MSGLKSKSALIYNIRLLSEHSKVRFWTFTLPVVLHPVEAAAMWGDLARELKRSCGFRGVRVFELHPQGHGLHVHVLTPDYIPVQVVRPIALKMGWGRIDVELWDENTDVAGLYMAKYLTKQIKSWRGVALKGVRWWGVFGKVPDSERVRVCDVQIDSPRRRIWDGIPAWFVTAVMGVACAYKQGTKKPLTVKEQKLLEEARHAFSVRRTGKPKVNPSVDVKASPARAFNWAKMWVCNRIYFLDERFLAWFDGSQKEGFGFDPRQLREFAFLDMLPCPL